MHPLPTLLDTTATWLNEIALLSWKGAMLTSIVGLVLMILRRHLSPAWRHGLWLLVLLRFIVPDVGTSVVSLSGFAKVPERLAPAPVESPQQIPLLSETEATEPAPTAPRQNDPLPEISKAERQAPTPPVVNPTRRWVLIDVLTLGWLIGMVGIGAGMVLMHLRLLFRIRRDSDAANDEINSALHDACKLAGVASPPHLIITDAVHAPALFGIIRPAILLPRDLISAGPSAALRLIFLHELAHLQRRDLWAQVAAALIVVLHWFNPVVWVAARRMRAEAEMAADAHALRSTNVTEAHRLGEVLLGFAHRATTGWMVWFATSTLLGISENKRDLKHRIEALMDIAKGRRTRWIVGLGIFLLLGVVGLTKAPAEDVKKPPTKETKRVLVPPSGDDPETPGPQPKAVKRVRVLKPVSSDEPKSAEAPRTQKATETPSPPDNFTQTSVIGTVIAKEDGKPIAGAQVLFSTFYGSDSPISIIPSGTPATTDDSGAYSFETTFFNGRGIILVHAPGKEVLKLIIDRPKDGSSIRLKHVLAVDEGIKGTVVDAQDRPVKGASLMLSTRSLFLRETPSRQSGFLHTRSTSGYWVGEPSSGADGAFAGHSFNRDTPTNEWLVVTHPEHGIQKVRMSEWKNAGRLQLEPWATLEGVALDEKGQPIPHATLSIGRSEYVRSQKENIAFSISQPIECVTDEQGRFRLEKVLPGIGSTYAKWKDTFFDVRLRPLNPGDKQQVTLRPRQAKPSPSARDLRDITGRIILPKGKEVRSQEHEVKLSLQLLGQQTYQNVNEPDEEGRFWTRPKPPGEYQLSIWVQPKDNKLTRAPNSGFTRRFKLEKDAENTALNLGEMSLTTENFAFVPAKTNTLKTARHADQRLNAPAVDASQFATWSACAGSGTTEEKAFETDGRIQGISPVSSNGFFMIRATQSDGSRHYSDVLTCTKDASKDYQQQITFRPGTSLKGKVTDVPKDTADHAWVVAAVKVQNPLTPDSTHIGWLHTLTWYAWTPMKPDGSFHFPSLPRGSLNLVAFGEGWISSKGEGDSPEITADLSEAKPGHELTLSTQTCYDKNLRLVLADGSPLASAKVNLFLTETTGLHRAWGRWGHAIEAADKDAYQRYKSTPIPGHSATTDSEGHATLRNLHYRSFGATEAEVTWTNPKSGKEQTARIKFSVGLKARETITVQPVSSNQ
jgi:beta-lactamase regulating signal transducer with metallopeptidase domain